MASSVIAVDLGGTKVAAAAVDARGRVRRRVEEPVDASVEQIIRLVKSCGTADAVGVAVPGLVRANGTVWAPNLSGWDEVPLAKMMKRKLRIPVVVESDRNAAVIGEAWRGAARGKRDVIVLIIGTGIGAGILSGGRIIRGAHELSGCAGWMVVSETENEMTSRCGSLEALAAGPALARLGGTDAAKLADAARRGDRTATRVFSDLSRLLGHAVANLISLLDPEMIVLTGGLANAADVFLDGLKHHALARAQPLSAPKVSIVVTKLGTEANLLGAARLALSANGD